MKRCRFDNELELNRVMKSGITVKESIISRIKSGTTVSPTGCWEWNGCLTPNGYPQMSVDRRPHYAHRASFAAFKSTIYTGAFICHSCDNPKCVNPDHLFAGTQKDNIGDAIKKRRLVCGEKSKKAKLNDNVVRLSRSMYRRGDCTIGFLAEKFGVSIRTMGKAVSGKKWKHVV
jgi:hypothetical protein